MSEHVAYLYVLTARDPQEAAAVLTMLERVQEHLRDAQPSMSAAVARRRAERALVGLTLRRDGHSEGQIARVLGCDPSTVLRDQELLCAVNAGAIRPRARRWTCAGCGTVERGELPDGWAHDATTDLGQRPEHRRGPESWSGPESTVIAPASAVRCRECAAARIADRAAGEDGPEFSSSRCRIEPVGADIRL
jgi:hypothetical protein